MHLRMALVAPLALKEPVFCRFSHLKKSDFCANASSVEDVSTGVLWT